MKVLKSYSIATATALMLTGGVTFAQNQMVISDQVQKQFNSGEGVTKDWAPSLVLDGVYDRVAHVNQPVAWQGIREADILWKKRVWREIDIREKQNQAFRYPGDDYTGGGFFIEIVLDAVKKGKVKTYSNLDDRFTTTLSKEQIFEILIGKPDTTMVEVPETGEMKMVITQREFNPDNVTKYRIKEDWVFDRNLGRMVVRIIGVAPIKDIYNDDGTFRGSQAVFWLYYPELRPMLAQYEVFNPDNDMARMTWDEYFEGRFFSSRIIKTSNPFDMNYRERGLSGLEALYEGQKDAEKLFNKEHDMWVY
jgi:gliding motility associated protien GldN